jgi:hypothetical protein
MADTQKPQAAPAKPVQAKDNNNSLTSEKVIVSVEGNTVTNN